MPHVVVAGPLHPSGCAVLDGAQGVSVTYIQETSEPSLAAQVDKADAVLLRTQPMGADTIAKAPNLKIVSRHGVGYDAVDVEALTARNIALTVCADVNSTTVAEHTAMMILAASKRVLRADASVRAGPWEWRNRLEARDVSGRTLLIVGFGRIGRKTARMMAAFGLRVHAYDPYLSESAWPDPDVTPARTLAEGLALADIVCFCLPHTGQPLIGAAEFAAMRDGVVLVNTARGGIVDEAALVAALESGKVGAAGIDVFASEPVPDGAPLKAFDQVLLTPHIAGLTQDAAERIAVSSAENILAFFDGTLDHTLIVNKDKIHALHKTNA